MEMIVGNFWHKSLKAMGKTLLVVGCLAVILFLWVTISFNRAQPSSVETDEAIMLGHALQKYVSRENQSIFSGAGRNKVTVEIYGIFSKNIQEKILSDIRNSLINFPFNGKIYVYFFPEREYTKNEINGLTVFELKKSELLREIEIIQYQGEKNVRF